MVRAAATAKLRRLEEKAQRERQRVDQPVVAILHEKHPDARAEKSPVVECSAPRENGDMEMNPNIARAFWKALMDNATGLIADANALLAYGSRGRARSFTVLAQEELGKALWLYEVFSASWNTGSTSPLQVERLKTDGRRHAVKYMEAFVFGQELAEFWGNYSTYEYSEDDSQEGWNALSAEKRSEAEVAGKHANEEKMAGFYVDLGDDGVSVHSPSDVLAGTIAEDLQTAAQVIEMLLIKDHTRMKNGATTPYDSTHTQQHRLLPISHPEDWYAASDEFKHGGNWEQPKE